MAGLAGNDLLLGEDGNDDVIGFGGRDVIVAGDGNDNAFGGPQDDLVLGGDGDDNIFGNFGADSVQGGAGNDYMSGDNPNPIPPGPLPFAPISGPDFCSGGPGSDTVVGCESVSDGSEPGGPSAPPGPTL